MNDQVNKLHRNLKLYRSKKSKQQFISLRREYRKNVRTAHSNYKLDLEQMIDESPKKFFDHVNEVVEHKSYELTDENEVKTLLSTIGVILLIYLVNTSQRHIPFLMRSTLISMTTRTYLSQQLPISAQLVIDSTD